MGPKLSIDMSIPLFLQKKTSLLQLRHFEQKRCQSKHPETCPPKRAPHLYLSCRFTIPCKRMSVLHSSPHYSRSASMNPMTKEKPSSLPPPLVCQPSIRNNQKKCLRLQGRSKTGRLKILWSLSGTTDSFPHLNRSPRGLPSLSSLI